MSMRHAKNDSIVSSHPGIKVGHNATLHSEDQLSTRYEKTQLNTAAVHNKEVNTSVLIVGGVQKLIPDNMLKTDFW